jgi:hypothetical protein
LLFGLVVFALLGVAFPTLRPSISRAKSGDFSRSQRAAAFAMLVANHDAALRRSRTGETLRVEEASTREIRALSRPSKTRAHASLVGGGQPAVRSANSLLVIFNLVF